MNLSQLYYFRKLAEVKHYTHAAEELFISQPTLSNSISQLERELGIPLFEREGRKIKLTKYGEEFYQYATEAVNALEKGIALAHEHAGSPTGSIDIGAIYTIQSDYLPSLIKGYRDQYGKDAQVNVFQGLTQPLLEDLESNRYELAFTAYVDSKPDLTFVPVLTQRLVAVVHRSDKLAWSKNHLRKHGGKHAGHHRPRARYHWARSFPRAHHQTAAGSRRRLPHGMPRL